MATLVRWSPLRPLTSFQDEVDSLLDSVYGCYPRDGRGASWVPSLDVEETKDAIIVRAELPGMKKEDIKVSLEGDVLSISGERHHEAEQKDRTFHRVERSYGRFLRSMTLPVDVKADKVSAAYKDGVLELTLPKGEEAKVREIAIQ